MDKLNLQKDIEFLLSRLIKLRKGDDEMKRWYQSKTIGFGATLAALGLAILALPEFQALLATLPTEYTGYGALIISVVTVILRWVTDKPIE
jgi:hypothetical protein